MEFEQHGYEQFEEYPGLRGHRQNILSTIEFGLSPFVPFSEDYSMYHGALPGNGFGVHASSEPPVTPEWQERISDYLAERQLSARGNIGLGEDVSMAPAAEIKSRAETLSRRIMMMLEQENIAQQYDSTVRGEIEEQAMALMGRKWPWEDPSVNEQIDLIDTANMRKLGGETFDLYGKTENSRQILELNLHMISRQLGPDGPDFIKGVRAMETTNMTSKKWFQVKMFENENASTDRALAWDEGVKQGVAHMMIQWDFARRPFEDIYEDIGKQTKKKGSPETVEYFARQTLSRFAEIEAGQFGSAFIFHAPIDKYVAGYARLEPVIKNKMLTNVKVKTGTIGGADFQDLVNQIGDAAFQEVGTRYSYASNAQILLWDAQERGNLSDAELLAETAEVYQNTANQLALRSERGQLAGQGLGVEMGVGLGNVVMESPRVQAVEVMGSTDATDLVEKQVRAFFLDPGIKTQFEQFYKKAMKGSRKVTSSWKKLIEAEDYTVNKGGIYANKGGPFTTDQDLQGVGIPFWFLIGRDPTGFEKFKAHETHSEDKFKAENLMSGKTWLPPEKRGITMKGGMGGQHPLKGKRVAVRYPQEHYIGGGTRTKTGAWKEDYMKQDWRAEYDSPYGSVGVLNDDMSEVEDILTGRSRVGKVNL